MGLGTKIKEALSGDKDTHNSRRRKTPGAYPESSVDIPRTDTTNTWQSSHTNATRPGHDNKAESITEEDDDQEYTHAPGGGNQARYDSVSPISEHDGNGAVAGQDSWAKPKKHQYPYWGEFGKPDTNDFAAVEQKPPKVPEKVPGVGTVGKSSGEHSNNLGASDGYRNQAGYDDQYTAQTNEVARNDTVSSNTHPALRGNQNGDKRGEHMNQFNLPTGSVNRGRATIVDDEAAKASSMVASQVSQPSQATDGYGGADQSYNQGPNNYGVANGAYDREYENSPSVQRSGTVNSRGPAQNTYGAAVLPIHNRVERSYSPDQRVPVQNAGADAADPFYTQQAGVPYGQTSPGPNGAGIPQNFAGQRERSSPLGNTTTGSSGSPTGQVGGDHYGPGHPAARVLHRCQHCGNDNDITKYFSKDVVYRLS